MQDAIEHTKRGRAARHTLLLILVHYSLITTEG